MSSPIAPRHAQLLIDRIYAVRADIDEAAKKILWVGRAPKKDPPAPVGEDQPLNTNQIAAAMGVHRSTVSQWKREGYVFDLGRKTTLRHCKEWLRNRRQPDSDVIRRAELLRSLR
jgi:hypothetical protein